MKSRLCEIFWKAIIKVFRCHRKEYLKAVSMGKDVYLVCIEKYVPADQELQRWIDYLGDTKPDALGETTASN